MKPGVYLLKGNALLTGEFRAESRQSACPPVKCRGDGATVVATGNHHLVVKKEV